MGYSGKGVIVTIIDDGVEGKHVDLAKNFVSCIILNLSQL